MRYGVLLAGIVAIVCATPVLAQYRNDDPNLRNFYMARQQIQIMDDAPLVNDMRTVPGQPGQQGGMPTQRQALPRAGFGSQMSPSMMNSGMRNNLPQVINGVPPKLPPVQTGGPVGQKATAQKMKKPAGGGSGGGSSPTVARTYTPYKTFSGPAAAGTGANSGGGMQSSGTVQGSLLHWNKRRSAQQF